MDGQQYLPFGDQDEERSGTTGGMDEQKESQRPRSGEGDLCYVILDDLSAEDNLVPALSDQTMAERLHNSRYVCVADGHAKYFGQVLRGPIYTPEWGAVRDGTNIYPIVSGDKVEYVPSYHGFVQIQILGEIEDFGGRPVLRKTFHRPHPKSRVSYMPTEHLLSLLRLPEKGSILGVLANYATENAKDAIPFYLDDKLIRKQVGIFGATGQGKSNTVLATAEALAQNGWCVILFDHSGEYTECNQPSNEQQLFTPFWRKLKVECQGVPNFVRLVPVSDRSCPKGAIRFSVQSKTISFAVLKSLLRLSETQDEKIDRIKRELGSKYDGLTSLHDSVMRLLPNDPSRAPLLRKIDNLIALGGRSGSDGDAFHIFDNVVPAQPPQPDNPALWGRTPKSQPGVICLTPRELIQPGTVIDVDFGNTSRQDIINVVALDILTKLERAKASVQRANHTKVAIFMEEAHTLFSAEYAGNEQVAHSLTSIVKRIFKIGRKFYLNPIVISQQPSDVPAAILSQCNTKIIHQLSDDDDIRKVTKGGARRYQNIIPDLRTGEALITNSEFTTAQVVRIRPAQARKIDPFPEIQPDAEEAQDNTNGLDYEVDDE